MQSFHIDPDISAARTLSVEFYTDPANFEDAKEKLFAQTWQYLTHAGQVAEPGKVAPVSLLDDYLGEHVMVIRDSDRKLRCLSNVCTHRGALLIDKPCTLQDIRCPYHGRRFQLDGTFLSMPEFREVKNFPTEADNLVQLPLYQLGNLLFTSLGKALPPEAYFTDMIHRINWLPLDQFIFRPDLSNEYTVHAHWALYCENYLEGFHIPFVHPSLNQVIDFGNYSTELFRYSSVQLGVARKGAKTFDLPASSPDFGKNIGAYYFWVFPNMMFNFYPWGLSVNIVKPVTPNQTNISFLVFMWDESTYNIGAGSNLNRVEMEDEAVVESVQKGIRSRFYSHGRYSVKHETGTHHFHRLIEEFMT